MTNLYVDNEQYIFISDLKGIDDKSYDVSEDLIDRYNLALLEWETVQDELAEIYKEKAID